MSMVATGCLIYTAVFVIMPWLLVIQSITILTACATGLAVIAGSVKPEDALKKGS
jgi:hypothetical protein